jgi:hypothetical protein
MKKTRGWINKPLVCSLNGWSKPWGEPGVGDYMKTYASMVLVLAIGVLAGLRTWSAAHAHAAFPGGYKYFLLESEEPDESGQPPTRGRPPARLLCAAGHRGVSSVQNSLSGCERKFERSTQ